MAFLVCGGFCVEVLC
ncbi:hypothetical protein M2G70_22025 [Vibrio vulnificus]|nr:hypothetical protein [Vibrio vulnificus]MCU8501329.1 hypothetical protein [Vibrio vulnificus]